MKNSYLVENEFIYFRRAKKEDNMEEIAKLLYQTDPYIYPFWFDNDEDKCIEFLKNEILKDGFIFNYNNLYVAFDKTINKIVGVICAIDKSPLYQSSKGGSNLPSSFMVCLRISGYSSSYYPISPT